MKIGSATVLITLLLFLTGCSSEDKTSESKPEKQETNVGSDEQLANDSEAYEQFIEIIDNTDSLNVANSLYYTRNDGASFEVELLLNDSSEIVRIKEQSTRSGSGSIETKWFYFKDGFKYATKEYFEEGMGDNAHFVERVSYYEKGKVKVTKMRSAAFEDKLEEEMFKVVDNHDCTDEKSLKALQQEGEFATNFQGFIAEGPATYLIVGEDSSDGYVSALLVQYYTPLMKRLMANESSMLGTPLEVQFETVHENTGYTFQALMNVSLAK